MLSCGQLYQVTLWLIEWRVGFVSKLLSVASFPLARSLICLWLQWWKTKSNQITVIFLYKFDYNVRQQSTVISKQMCAQYSQMSGLKS